MKNHYSPCNMCEHFECDYCTYEKPSNPPKKDNENQSIPNKRILEIPI